MILSKKKNAPEGLISVINVDAHVKCLVLNLGEKVKGNELFDFDKYNDMLNRCRDYVEEKDIERIKEYLIYNCPPVAKLIKENKPGEQFSLF